MTGDGLSDNNVDLLADNARLVALLVSYDIEWFELAELESLLTRVDRPGDFCMHAALAARHHSQGAGTPAPGYVRVFAGS
jgi:hypothetical protein